MSLFRAWMIYRTASVVSVVVCVLAVSLDAAWLTYTALGLVFASAVFGIFACRCPNCGHFLLLHTRWGKKQAYCPACGKSLEW